MARKVGKHKKAKKQAKTKKHRKAQTKKSLQRKRRSIEAKWYREIRRRGWRLKYGMLYKPSLAKKGKYKQQDREERRELKCLKKRLKEAGVDRVEGRFFV